MIRNILINQKDRQKIAVIDGEKTFLYNDLIKKALDIQQALPQQPGYNIALYLPNSSDFIAALFATAMLGLTAFPLNYHLTKYEVAPLLQQASVCTILTLKRFHSLFKDIQNDSPTDLQVVYLDALCTTEHELFMQSTNICPDKPMMLLTTSGSTGQARIVPLSATNIETSVAGYLDKMNFSKEDQLSARYLLASPLSSAYGIMILFVCLINALPIIFLKDGFTLNSFYQSAQEHKATHYEGGTSVLHMMEHMIGRPLPYDIGQLKNFGFGGGKISGNTLRKLSAAFPNIYFWQGYGMTEAAPLITKYTNTKAEKLDSVGTAINGVKIKVRSDNKITSKPYVQGEIIVKGANIMAGYYNNKTETMKMLKNGYLYTGDIGYLDEEGYLYICGRKKNIIIVRGFNVYPEEVESCLLDSSLVKDCVVYGEADASGNECLCADIVLISPLYQLSEIIAYCSRHLSSYKVPQKILTVEEIKKTAAGKTKRTGKDT